ncbi:MAG: hypothetical protein GC189_10840 [Alphaproteobacteria bacterium]|nr:hypothetical protein [Alphaproteobacteria bacterium]
MAACDRDASDQGGNLVRPSTVVEPEMRVDDVPQEEPGLARNRWRLANTNTRDVAGNLSASLERGRGGPLALAFANGITVRAEILSVYRANTRINAQGAFANLMGLDPRVDVNVYRVADETVAAAAPRGGLCGEARTQHVAVVEYVDEDGDWTMKIAAFKGRAAPGEGGDDPELCGVYIYRAA